MEHRMREVRRVHVTSRSRRRTIPERVAASYRNQRIRRKKKGAHAPRKGQHSSAQHEPNGSLYVSSYTFWSMMETPSLMARID